MKKWFYKIWRSWNPWYVLEVDHRGKIRRIVVSDFKKKTPNHIKGRTNDGEWFELKSATPMDYYIEEYKEDLK